MFKKKNRSKKRSRAMLSAYSIIMILIIILGILSHALPDAQYMAAPVEDESTSEEIGPGEWEGEVPAEEREESTGSIEVSSEESFTPAVGAEVSSENLPESEAATDETTATDEALTDEQEATVVSEEEATVESEEAVVSEETIGVETEVYNSLADCEEVNGEDGCVIVDGSGVVGAKLYQVLMAPILGFENAIDVCIFVMVLGGFLAVMANTKALETGIRILVRKMKGKEYLLIVALMFIFSILGTTYGFLEESVGFYVLIAATMFAAKFDNDTELSVNLVTLSTLLSVITMPLIVGFARTVGA